MEFWYLLLKWSRRLFCDTSPSAQQMYSAPALPQKSIIGILEKCMVLLERIELSTSPLPRECSTSELQQRRERLSSAKRTIVQPYSGRCARPALDTFHGREIITKSGQNRRSDPRRPAQSGAEGQYGAAQGTGPRAHQ